MADLDKLSDKTTKRSSNTVVMVIVLAVILGVSVVSTIWFINLGLEGRAQTDPKYLEGTR